MLVSKKAKDLVCGMEVKVTDSTLQTTFQDEVYYFCSSNCLSQFESDPLKYVTSNTKECCGSCGNSDEKKHDQQGHEHHGHCHNEEEHSHNCKHA